MKVLMITSAYPTKEYPFRGKFIQIQEELLKERGIDVQIFFFRGHKNPIKYLRSWFQVRKKLKDHDFDFLHAQFGQSAILALPKKKPLIISFRGTDLNGYISKNGKEGIKSKILTGLSRYVSKKADQVVVVSEGLSKKLPSSVKYHIIPTGLNFSIFRPLDKMESRKHLGLPLDKKIIFFPSNPDKPIKRYNLALKAIELYNEENDALLISAGSILFEQMVYYFNAADALLFTSSREGSPNAIKEALACNLPIVSVNVGDIQDRLKNISGCYLSLNDSPEELCKGLTEVLSNSDDFDGRKHVKSLDNDIVTKQLINIYKTLKKH